MKLASILFVLVIISGLATLGVLFAGLLLALSYLGGEAAQIDLGLPGAVTGIFQGILLFYLLGCDILIHCRLRLGQRVPALRPAKAES